jgi:RNA polymerase sigma-70 factor (ECF subfamily)
MNRTEVLTFPATAWEPEYLQDIALRNLILQHYDQENVAIQRYLIFLGINADDAQEIVQESFLKLHEHLLARGDRTNLRAWLYRVAHNLARNAQSAHRSSRTDSLPDATVAGDLPANAISAEDALLADEQMRRLRQAMEQLTPAQKEALMLRTQGLKYREIADVLSLSVSTVGETIQRGLERLKELL